MTPGYLITIILGVVASVIFFIVVKIGGGLRRWIRAQWAERRRQKANEEMIEHLQEIEGKDGFL
jgi:hypothetical protein